MQLLFPFSSIIAIIATPVQQGQSHSALQVWTETIALSGPHLAFVAVSLSQEERLCLVNKYVLFILEN